MANDVRLNLGSGGDLIAADEVGGKKYQRIKPGFGADGSYSDVEATNPFPVQLLDASGNAVSITNNGLDINIQDQHTLPIHGSFAKLTAAPTTLSVAASAGDYTLTVTTTTGFVDGANFELVDATGTAMHGVQLGAISGNTITIDRPVERAFAIGATIFPMNINMNVDGSSTVQKFQFGPIGTLFEVDVTRIMGYLQDATTMDDGMFGGTGSALTRGCVFRKNYGDGTFYNYGNAKTNGALAMANYDFAYTDKAPGGNYGARWRGTFAGPSKRGVTIRLGAGESLEWLIQDDLTGLQVFNLMAQGHIVE